jgi:hypothetical protein
VYSKYWQFLHQWVIFWLISLKNKFNHLYINLFMIFFNSKLTSSTHLILLNFNALYFFEFKIYFQIKSRLNNIWNLDILTNFNHSLQLYYYGYLWSGGKIEHTAWRYRTLLRCTNVKWNKSLLNKLLETIAWKNDETILFKKNWLLLKKSRVVWW